MIPAITVTGGSVVLGAGWTALGALGPATTAPDPTVIPQTDPVTVLSQGQNLSGAVMLINTSTSAVVYFAYSSKAWAGSESAAPTPNPGPEAAQPGALGSIPVPFGSVPLIVRQPPGTKWWGASAALIVTPVEIQ